MRALSLIFKCTVLELVRSKTLIGAFILAIVFVGVSSLMGSVTLGDRLMVVRVIGLAAISLFSVGFAVISGTKLLEKELKARTVFHVLSKPIHRSSFVFGKWLGMWMTSSMLVWVMGGVLICWMWVLSGRFEVELLSPLFLYSFELFVVCGLAMFFSSIVVTAPFLGGLFTAMVWVCGRSVEIILKFSESLSSPLKEIVGGIGKGLPQLYVFSSADSVVYGADFSIDKLIWLCAYALAYGVVLTLIASFIFEKREIQ